MPAPRPAPATAPLALIGAPTDIGASCRGAGLGPEALRVAGLPEALRARGLTVLDHGNLAGPANPQQAAVDGHRHLPEVTAWCAAVRDAVATALAAGQRPLLLGGDHSLAMGSLAAVARHVRARGQRLRVLWLDAHADFNTAALTPSGNLHGMPLACLCGLGPPGLVDLAGPGPALRPKELRLIGVRSVDPGERALVHARGLDVRDMRWIDEHGMRAALTAALDGLDADTHLHLSLDLDVLDPALAPGVGTPVPGGLSYREAQLAMEMLADTGRLGSLDLMELNPACDERNRTAALAVDLLESLFGKSTLMRG